jgi:hypothetical protein
MHRTWNATCIINSIFAYTIVECSKLAENIFKLLLTRTDIIVDNYKTFETKHNPTS